LRIPGKSGERSSSSGKLEKDSQRSNTSKRERITKVCENCNSEYEVDHNNDTACRYHPGKKGLSYGNDNTLLWDCCKKPDLETGSTHTINTLIIGIKGVGKSCLTTRLALHQFLDEIRRPEIADTSMNSFCTQIHHQINYYHCLEEIPAVPPEDFLQNEFVDVLQKTELILLVCGVDDLQSLLKLEEYYGKIKGIRKDNGILPPIILVGNKSDVIEEQRKVSVNDLNRFEFATNYIEFSSKTGMGMDELMEIMLIKSINNGCCMGKHKKK